MAARRAALTGVSQTVGRMAEADAEEMGTDLVVVSAHFGARPEHAVWQGKIYSLSGESDKYPDLRKATGYGTGAGLKGWNCRHNFEPFIDGISTNPWSPEMLERYNSRTVEYDGKIMTEYEASQKQRAMERRIRATKRELAGYDSAIKATDNPALKGELQREFDRKSVLLKKQEAKIKDFTDKTVLVRQRNREQAAFQYNAALGKVTNFDKSVAQKAVQANKRVLKNGLANGIMKRKKTHKREDIRPISDKVFDDLTIDARKNGAIILRGTPEVKLHLDFLHANASSIDDILLFRKEVTISEVLEETYHFKQTQLKMFDEYEEKLWTCYREIDAKEYLLKNAKKYNIPRQETEETKKQLEQYRKSLETLTGGENNG